MMSMNKEEIKMQFAYKIVTIGEILQDINTAIDEVNFVLQLPRVTTRKLLNHMKWDKQKLYESYYGRDSEELFREAKIFHRIESNKCKKLKVSDELECCEICFDYSLSSAMYSLCCGHKYCRDCWISYLNNIILSAALEEEIVCPAPKCDVAVDDEAVRDLVTNKEVLVKYDKLIANTFVNFNKLMCWCSNGMCNYAAKVASVDLEAIKCFCGTKYCFICGFDWHEPIKCELLKLWWQKCNESEITLSLNWIQLNTKQCPKCNIPIQKTIGCNHIKCANTDCGLDFCWNCLKPMELHFGCNKYIPSVAVTESIHDMQRYQFFFNRYMTHMQCLQFEKQLHKSMEQRINCMQRELRISWIDAQFMKQAVDILCQCRQTLMYTYVFAYFVTPSNQSIIFEQNQSDFEYAIEVLAQYLERDFVNSELVEMKRRIQDKYNYCEQRRQVLVQHIQEGYENELW